MDWRCISYDECEPAFNMAADEAILEAHLAGEVPPTLRIYGWKPPAVSIGYSQKISPDEIKGIRNRGLEVVRRATGGRAVLHLDDLTYSFVGTSLGEGTNKTDSAQSSQTFATISREASALNAVASKNSQQPGFLSNSVTSAYKQICQGLIFAIEEFGVTLELGSSQSDYRTNYDCFRATTNADLQFAGKKMIGSAQLRRKQAVLQHGSILLKQAQNKMNEVYGGSNEPQVDRHCNLFEVIGHELSFCEMEESLIKGFSKAFSVDIVKANLTTRELERIEHLIIKYRIAQ